MEKENKKSLKDDKKNTSRQEEEREDIKESYKLGIEYYKKVDKE